MNPVRLAVAPMAALALSVAVVLVAARRPVPRPAGPAPLTARALPRFLRRMVVLVVGGYLAMLGIVAVFHVIIVGEGRALAEAAAWGAFLVAIAIPVFVALTWSEGRLRQRR